MFKKECGFRYDVAIVGGGPAGLMAAIVSSRKGKKTVLIEKNGFCGKKLNITGKGRCNVTNNCDLQTFLSNVTKNNKFLYKSLSEFSTQDVINFFVLFMEISLLKIQMLNIYFSHYSVMV